MATDCFNFNQLSNRVAISRTTGHLRVDEMLDFEWLTSRPASRPQPTTQWFEKPQQRMEINVE